MPGNTIKLILKVLGRDSAEDAFRGVRQHVGALNESCKSLTGSFWKFYLGLQAATGALRGFSELINTPAMFEGFRTQLETLLGSAKDAERAFDWIKDFTQKTPFELQEVTDAFVMLQSVGIDAAGAMKSVGDTAAAMNRDIMDAATAVVSMEREVLRRYGIDLRRELDKATFIWTDAEGKKREKVVEGGDEIIRATLLSIWNERYEGGMDRFQTTWKGMWSNLADSVTNFIDTIGRSGFMDFLKERLAALNDWFVAAARSGELKEWAKKLSDTFTGIARLVLALAEAFGKFSLALMNNSHILKGAVAAAAVFVSLKLASMLTTVGDLAWAVKNLGFVIRYHAVTALTALAANPVTLAIAGISALIGLFVAFKARAKEATDGLNEFRMGLLGMSETSLKIEEGKLEKDLNALLDRLGSPGDVVTPEGKKIHLFDKLLTPEQEAELKSAEEKLQAVRDRLAEMERLKKDLAASSAGSGTGPAGGTDTRDEVAKIAARWQEEADRAAEAWEKVRSAMQFKVDSAGWSDLEKEVGEVTRRYEQLFDQFRSPAQQKLIEQALRIDVQEILDRHNALAEELRATWSEVAGELGARGGLKVRLAELTGGDVAAAVQEQINAVVEAIAQADPASEGYARLLELHSQYVDKLKEINEQAAADIEAQDAKSFRGRMQAFTGYLSQKTAALAAANKTFFQIHKIAAVSEGVLGLRATILDAYAAGTKVGGPALGAAFAAIAGAAQVANLQAIASANYNDSAASTALGQGAGTATSPVVTESKEGAPPEASRPAPTINIHVYGTVTSEDELARTLVPKLAQAVADGAH